MSTGFQSVGAGTVTSGATSLSVFFFFFNINLFILIRG